MIYLVSSAGIRTHDLLIVSLLPQPLDKGSHPSQNVVQETFKTYF